MILSILFILAIGVIGYFYWTQGLFTGLLSAAAGAIAAAVAVGYHENVVDMLFASKLNNSGNAFALVVIFAITFVAVRMLLDATVPGNIRLPALMDKLGGGITGAILGVFATGILAIAAQSMSFGPGILGYSRFKTQGSREVHVPTGGQASDTIVSDELVSEKFEDADRQTLLIPVDEWVLGFVGHLSNGGSVAGQRTLASIHPNYLDELFGQRIGIQPGADHVVYNAPGHTTLTVPLAYQAAQLNKADAEIPQIRGGTLHGLTPNVLKADPANAIVIVRAMFTANTADEDRNVRFSTGGVRLVANGVNYYPLGTLDETGTLLLNKPDDPLFVSVADKDHGADFVFSLPTSASAGVLTTSAAAPAKGQTAAAAAPSGAEFSPGVFFEFKRLARVDLSGLKIGENRAYDDATKVLRKSGKEKAKSAGIPPTFAPAGPPIAAGIVNSEAQAMPLSFENMDLSPTLFHSVAVGKVDGDPAQATFPSGSAEVRGATKIARLTVNPTTPLASLSVGDNALNQLFVPPGKKAVQAVCFLPAQPDNPWAWAERLSEFAIVDTTGTAYKPSGAAAKVLKSAQPMMVAAYDADNGVPSIAKTPDVRPTDVWLLFLVPPGTTMKELDFTGKRLASINLSVS